MGQPKLIIVRPGNDENHVAVWQRNVGWRQMSLAGLAILRAYLDSRNQEMYHG